VRLLYVTTILVRDRFPQPVLVVGHKIRFKGPREWSL
jgi:hypothetical protein